MRQSHWLKANAFASQGNGLQAHRAIVASQPGYIECCMRSTLKLQPVSPGVCRVLTNAGLHVGNLKLIGGSWKFKAIGYDVAGQVVPGGGPLTAKHNVRFAALDEDKISQTLT